MKKTILALFVLLTLASQGTWCAAERSTMIDAAHLRPHLQVEELHGTEGKELLEIGSPRKLGHGHSLTHHEVSTVEKHHPRRMAIGHKGGSMAGATGGGAGGGGKNTGGGAADTRPHNTKNGGAVALPAPVISVLALVFTGARILSAFTF